MQSYTVRYRRGIAALEWEWTEEGVTITPIYSGLRGALDRLTAWMVETALLTGYAAAVGAIRRTVEAAITHPGRRGGVS
jgi:hypothetical protein